MIKHSQLILNFSVESGGGDEQRAEEDGEEGVVKRRRVIIKLRRKRGNLGQGGSGKCIVNYYNK